MKPIIDIPNSETEIGRTIKMLLTELDSKALAELLKDTTQEEFISNRVETYFAELTTALDAGIDELGAKEIARAEAFAGLQ